jgi:hypothetical protein
MNVGQRCCQLMLRVCSDKAQQAGRRGHHPHSGGQALDPLVVSKRGDTRLKRLVLALQRRSALDRATEGRAEFQDFNLHRDDSGEQDAEDRDPRPASDEPVDH